MLVDDGLDLLDILPPHIPADVRASPEQDGIECQDWPSLAPLRNVGKQPCHLIPPQRGEILVIKKDTPCLGTKQCVDAPEQGGLSDAVRTEDGEDLVAVDPELHLLEYLQAIVAESLRPATFRIIPHSSR